MLFAMMEKDFSQLNHKFNLTVLLREEKPHQESANSNLVNDQIHLEKKEGKHQTTTQPLYRNVFYLTSSPL